MTSMELLARLSALLPPPRYPLTRYHGVLAPRSAWRREIVPRAPASAAAVKRGPEIDEGARLFNDLIRRMTNAFAFGRPENMATVAAELRLVLGTR